LFTIARRLWLNDIRRAERAQHDADASEVIETIPDTALPTEVNILARQVFDQVMALPEKHRVVVLLVYVEGYTYLEASQLLEIPVGTVMSRLANARKALNGENVKTRKEGSR
jgi:RNA polymerase sigma-70 factor (ECF subfamily)